MKKIKTSRNATNPTDTQVYEDGFCKYKRTVFFIRPLTCGIAPTVKSTDAPRRVVTVWFPALPAVSACDSSVLLPHTRGQAAEEEGDVALDEGREEGKHAVDGEGDEEGLPSADPIRQAAPHEGPDHHPQVNNQT